MLKRIKTLLGINDQDELLQEIIDIVQSRVMQFIRTDFIPKELEYVIVEGAVNRFNRLSSEGTLSHTVEGESWSFDGDELEPYKNDLREWIKNNSSRGKVRFI